MEMRYWGFEDTVNATAVWATLTAVEHDNATYANLIQDPRWAPIDTLNPPRTMAQFMGGTGLIPVNPNKPVMNGIWMRFTVTPHGVWNESNVRFDITRRLNRGLWSLDVNQQVFDSTVTPFPLQNEQANDDPLPNEDESDMPDEDGHMWVVDAPGRDAPPFPAFPPLTPAEEYAIARWNMEEFVRVSFDGVKPDGPGVLGSRASAKYEWHCRHYLQSDHAGWWVRTTGDQQETDMNDVAPGAIVIGPNP
jgi:hypothetical protein